MAETDEDQLHWETRELAFISLLLKTNDSRLPTHVDLSNRKGKSELIGYGVMILKEKERI